MKNATFYLLDNDTTVDGLSAVEQLVCEIAAERREVIKRALYHNAAAVVLAHNHPS
ncbi:hypothetical protein O5833_28495, partial [Escherichia coli]|nr:hypothetical protein [Escherichia coli]